MKTKIVTIDGPSGSGKSTVAKRLAVHYKVPCLDTGAMYRTVAYECQQRQIPLDDETQVTAVAQSLSFEFGITDEMLWAEVIHPRTGKRRLGVEIRSPEVSMAASSIARIASLRSVLVRQQQEIGEKKGAVVEGRDAGTVIFPDARFKFFVTASAEERAKRRFYELIRLGKSGQSYDEVLRDVIQRDRQDTERLVGPLKPADDAVIVDTTGLNLDEVVATLIHQIDVLSGQ